MPQQTETDQDTARGHVDIGHPDPPPTMQQPSDEPNPPKDDA
ncbi:MAG: hypothetical protein AAF481_10890 [Acidobacteriota bacterium]